MAIYLPFLCLAITCSWPTFASAYRQQPPVTRVERVTVAIGSSIFLGAMALLFMNEAPPVGVLLFLCAIGIALAANRFLVSRWSLLAAATSFGSYLVGTVH